MQEDKGEKWSISDDACLIYFKLIWRAQLQMQLYWLLQIHAEHFGSMYTPYTTLFMAY